MKLRMGMVGVLLCFLIIPGVAHAQQQAKTPSNPAITHLRVGIVLTEYSGTKKISSMPYMLYVGVGDAHYHPTGSLRMGVKVPIATGYADPKMQIEYEDVGTRIDVNATGAGDNLYRLQFTVGRSAVSSSDEGAKTGEQMHVANSPILRSFGSSFELNLRDGESAEAMSATDPFSGNVLKANVTIHVVK